MENNDAKDAANTEALRSDIVRTETVRDIIHGINPETGLPIGLKVVSKPPKKNCKKCYGRGHIGWIEGDRNQPYPCMCTLEVVPDEPEPYKEKTATQSCGGPIPAEPNVTSNELPKPTEQA